MATSTPRSGSAGLKVGKILKTLNEMGLCCYFKARCRTKPSHNLPQNIEIHLVKDCRLYYQNTCFYLSLEVLFPPFNFLVCFFL